MYFLSWELTAEVSLRCACLYVQAILGKKDNSVKGIFIIGLIPNIEENYYDLLKICHFIHLSRPNCFFVNLESYNCRLEINKHFAWVMSYGSSHPCTWCDSHKSSLRFKGILKTLGSLKEVFWHWFDVTNQSSKSQAKTFSSVLHCPILKGESSEKLIDLLPSPELHPLIGPFNKLKELEKEELQRELEE